MRLALGVVVLGLLLAGGASAQQVKPRILLVFDTSGSMGFDLEAGVPTGGDNSAEYPGDGRTSRLYVAKNVIAGIVQTTSEVEFALMRYPQVEGQGINDGAGREAYSSYRGLDRLPLNYAGACAGTLRQEDPQQPFALLEGFVADNENPLLRWLNHREAWPADRELRAEGPTPLAESLRLAERYYAEVLPADEALGCRRSHVVLLTDGAESCIPEADRQRVLLERTLALREMNVMQDGRRVRTGVRVFVVAFAVEPAYLSLLDAVARAGGTAVNARGETDLIAGRAHQATDEAGLRRAFARILAEAIPVETCDGTDEDCDGRIDEGTLNACGGCGPVPAEVCNGLDDDCDGFTDEGVRNRCGGCGPVPAEVCNGIDDDCDGVVDEAVQNACGGCAGVREEVCNGLDDDCDGRVDNEPGTDGPLARPCGRDVGECTSGQERCRGGVWSGCDGVAPVEEVCNGRDDDCDGLVDEATRPCGPAVDIGNVGQCRVGVLACDAECEGAVGPSAEVCDGLDNDCDGRADEGLINACGQCGPEPIELCNGRDDDCDGRIDDAARCPRGYLCWLGECVPPCDPTGECPGGFTCLSAWPEGRFCHPDACAGAECAPGQICDADARRCVDPCAGVGPCPAGTVCELGGCVPESCRHTGCPAGERCTGDACAPDPCAGVRCDDDTFCRDGACVPACRGDVCAPGERCVDGECHDDPCGGRCLRGQRCDARDGLCVQDPCLPIDCPAGTACVDGECRDDAPCAHVRCPEGTRCQDGACTDFTPSNPPDPDDVPDDGVPLPDLGIPPDSGLPPGDVGPAAPAADGGPGRAVDGPVEEGCSCSVGGAPVAPWLLLPFFFRRRARRAGTRGAGGRRDRRGGS